MEKTKITLGLVQMRMGADAGANLSHALDLVAQAARKGASIVCLPELFDAPYFAQYEKESEMGKKAARYAQTIPGPVSSALSSAAKKNKITLVGGSIYEKDAKTGKLYNTSLTFGPDGKMLGLYRKIHIPHDPNFYEQDYFQKGDTGFKVFEAPSAGSGSRAAPAKISPLICYDQWYPEAARVCALMGADIIFYPTAIGVPDGTEQAEGPWQEAWENVMRGHAIANNVIVAAVNRAGREDQMEFWGGSFVCDAFGKTLASAGKQEEVLLVPVDLSHSQMVREGWRFFYNRRPDMYRKLLE
ncbi:MAG: nitrilase-related carbon-nitrogen hydrolase [Candidatus Micrarchaeota archaeon]